MVAHSIRARESRRRIRLTFNFETARGVTSALHQALRSSLFRCTRCEISSRPRDRARIQTTSRRFRFPFRVKILSARIVTSTSIAVHDDIGKSPSVIFVYRYDLDLFGDPRISLAARELQNIHEFFSM